MNLWKSISLNTMKMLQTNGTFTDILCSIETLKCHGIFSSSVYFSTFFFFAYFEDTLFENK